jgi:nuclear GTP-binding protein
MGTGKKEASRRERQGKVGDGMANVKTKGENFYRSVCLNAISAHVFD